MFAKLPAPRFWTATLLILALADAVAAEIMLCPEPLEKTDSAYASRVVLPDGSSAQLLVSERRGAETGSHCRSLRLPIPATAVVWAGPLSRREAESLGKSLVLQGHDASGRFEVSEIVGSGRDSPSRDVLSGRAERVFGVEERARFAGNRLSCRAGAAPAGVVLPLPARGPEGLPLTLNLTARGHGRFRFAIADESRLENGNALEIGSADLDARASRIALPLPPSPQAWSSLTVLCPAAAASAELFSFSLGPPPGAPPPPRAAWVWSPEAWADRPESIWALQSRHRLGSVYLTIPSEDEKVRHSDLLAGFIREARRRGLEVWAVSGDPRDVLPGGATALAERLRAYAGYNARSPEEARLAGVQLDIEPYLLPGYRLAPDAWQRRYLETVRQVRTALDPSLPLDLVVPVWWGSDTSLLDALARLDVSLTAMNYRTEAAALLAGAQPFLAWGRQHGRRVAMAIETGPLPDETRRHYESAAGAGEVWLLPFADEALLVLLSAPTAGLPGRAYRFSRATPAPAGRLTFAGDIVRMEAAMQQVLPWWSAWPDFAGLALHGLDALP